ncbi:MAG TPA: serine--tRNA ligase [Lentisphaeria bacterium]|nr:MAG: serine--tRNA ligase [Lentisphaerae bacterium GWF2_50_93]HCE46623.1 serine--tRNA ligase [Lentisphaeria bacterium]
MIDIKLLRDNPEFIKKNCEVRGAKVDVDAIVALDKEMRELTVKTETMRSDRNRLSKECKDKPEARDQVKKIKEELALLEPKLVEMQKQLDAMMGWLPNIISPETPAGKDDTENKEIRQVGEVRKFSFKPKDHQELGDLLGVIDAPRGVKVAKSGFYYWKGKGAQLCNAMFFWTQMELIKKGFTSFITPCCAKERTLFGTGYLPFFADQTFKIEKEDLALIGTSEQTLVAFHTDETLNASTLPLRYTAFSPCFRTEAGSYGKATKGIFRVHQFHKVEQIIFCLPEESEKYHQECLVNEEFLLQKLGIPYRVVDVCLGDMGAPGYRKYDTEAWFPGFGGYREVTSNTNLTDFQARRLNIKYKKDDGTKGFVHTISATAVTDRVAIAILENFQQEDGSVIVPEVLRPFTGFDRIEAPK